MCRVVYVLCLLFAFLAGQMSFAESIELVSPAAHSLAIEHLAFSTDGKFLASGSQDGTVRVWDLRNGQAVCALDGHSGPVQSLSFSRQGAILMATFKGGASRSLDFASGAPEWTTDPGTGAATKVKDEPTSQTADGDLVVSRDVTDDGQLSAAGLWNGRVSVYAVPGGRLLHNFPAHSRAVLAVTFSPDGKKLATAGFDKTIRLWDTSSGRMIGSLSGSAAWIFSLAFSVDGKSLACGSDDTMVRLWSLAGDEVMRVLPGHWREVRALAFSEDGKSLVSGSSDGSVRVWDVEKGEETQNTEITQGGILAVAALSDGKAAAVCASDKKVVVIDAQADKDIHVFPDQPCPVASAAFGPAMRTVAVGRTDGSAALWNLGQASSSKTFTGESSSLEALTVSHDGKALYGASFSGQIRGWDIATGAPLATIKGDEIAALACDSKARLLAGAGPRGVIRLWSMPGGREVARLVPIDEREWVVLSPDGRFDASDGAMQVACNHEGKLIPLSQFPAGKREPGLLKKLVAPHIHLP